MSDARSMKSIEAHLVECAGKVGGGINTVDETAITKQIRRASRELPEDFELQILIQKDYVIVSLLDQITELTYSPDSAGMTISEQIADCLAHAQRKRA